MTDIKIKYDKVLDGLGKLADLDLTNAMELIGITVENNAKIECPVGDTGLLRRSITHTILDDKTVEIGTNVEYSPYVELGTGIYALNGDGRKDVPWSYQTADGKWHSTSGQHPKQYMKKGLDASEADIIKIITNEIRRQIDARF